MKIMLASLVLNESEFLHSNYRQHLSWPDMVAWCFVESACRTYGEAHPEAVSRTGLSFDNTSDILNHLARKDKRIRYIAHGWAGSGNPFLEKCEARNRYLDFADEVQPDAIVVVDADEFYTHADQKRINALVEQYPLTHCWLYPQRHLWRPPAIAHYPRTEFEVTGGYWKIEHARVWRHVPGMRYWTQHNCPQFPDSKIPLLVHTYRGLSNSNDNPQCIHFGFARDLQHRKRTNRYYEARGEGKESHGTYNRGMYVACRAAWETWAVGDPLPHRAEVKLYEGPIPEVFKEDYCDA